MTGVLSDLVGAAARRAPDAVAVIDGERTVTYGALDALVSTVSDRLRSIGVGRGDRVGLLLDKSVEAVAAVHGVLRAGAAYVPLDPAAPPARLAVIAEDCGLATLVGDAAGAARWTALADAAPIVRTVVLVDDEPVDAPPGLTVVQQVVGALATAPPVDPDDLAYVLYTSGTTGRSKGVQLTHANGWAFVAWALDALTVGAEDRLSSHAPFHFDLSVFDLFASAAAGAALVLVPRAALVLPGEAIRTVERHGITIWYSVPSALALLVARGGLAPGRLPSLRVVVFAGEVMPTSTLAALMEVLPEATFWNWYGPTETNVCTAHEVLVSPADDGPSLPIGRPIEGVAVVVVDDDLAEVEPGVEGELLVTGATVTVGYHGDPDLTSTRLVDRGDGRRWYRTGDVVVLEPDGELVFRGRRDHQVKSRGHRIELGDVEAALAAQPDVVEAVVVPVPDPLVTNLLHAFVTVHGERDGASILAACRGRLPAPLVPASVTVVADLPRTATGKVDRRALAASIEQR